MKKTPLDLASSPIINAANAIVAVTALSGIAIKAIPVAKASDYTYDTKLQKRVDSNEIDMRTYTTTQTKDLLGNVNDSKTTTDQF